MILWERLVEAAATRPDKPAVEAPDATLTFHELVARADAAAAALSVANGVRPGDRVAYLGLNSAALVVLVFAAARGGFMLAPLNWRLAAEELAWIVGDAEPSVVVADDEFLATARGVAGASPVLEAAPFGAGSRPSTPASAEQCRDRTVMPDAPVLLVYTSGATGRPKGTLLSQQAVVANARLAVDMHDMTGDDRILTALPMFHVGGLNIQTVPALLTGASVSLMDRFHPARCLATMQAWRPTLTVQVPATLQALMAEPGWPAADLSSLRAIATGSTDVPVPLIEAVHRKGVPVIQIYGATETGPVVVYQKIADAGRVGSIGRPGPGVEVRLLDAAGAEVPEGETGEILVRSPTLASRYWRSRDADAGLGEGWFRTGDMARRDAGGFLWFADRIRNVIISGGENIYPAELERVLREVPGIREASVVARPDARWGAVPVAAVVGDVGREAVLSAFEGRLARFKHPKDVVFLDALPRNAMGKVETAKLADLVAKVAGATRQAAGSGGHT